MRELDQKLCGAKPGSRREALRTMTTYAGLAVFSAACALYVLLRYVLFARRRPRATHRHA